MGSFRDDEARTDVRRELSGIADGDFDPYAAGMRVLGLSMANVGSDWFRHPLWLLWGALTDMVDGPRGDPEGGRLLMREAASEWVRLPNVDHELVAYFDRWLYDVIGYERPT